MILLAAFWLSGILLGQSKLWMLFIFLCSYSLWILIFLSILRRYPPVLFPFVSKERYGAMTVFLLCLPALFCGGFLRRQAYEQHQKEQLAVWQEAEQAGETHIFVDGMVSGKIVEENGTVTLTLSDCQVSVSGDFSEGEESESATAGDCQVTVEEEGSKWMAESFIGNRVRVYGKFYLFDAAGNPGQFDAASYYHGKGVFASVRALRLELLSDGISVTRHALFLLKQTMRETLQMLYPEEKSGVLAAMLLGDKDMLPEEVKNLYQQNGISHILAISGLHISMLCMGLFRVMRKMGMPLLAAALCSGCFLGFYVVFTGAGTSSLRAGIMCLVLLAAKLLRRSYDLLSSLSFAAILVTFLRPGEIASAGFLLSFLAVAGVAVAQESMADGFSQEHSGNTMKEKIFGSLVNTMLPGGIIQLITIPVSLWFYYELSPYSFLLNLLIIPLATFVVGGGLFSVLIGLFAPGMARVLAGGVYLLLDFYEWVGRLVQKLPYSYVLVGRPAVWQMVVYYLVFAGTFLLLRKRIQKEQETDIKKESPEPGKVGIFKWGFLWLPAGCVCILILLFSQKQRFCLSFLDVSQGDGIVLQTENGKVLLFDGGSTDAGAVGEYRIGPFLKQQGIALIDTVSVSHMDSDHYSGVLELLETMPVYQGRRAYIRGYDGNVGIRELVLPKVSKPSEEYLAMVGLCAEKNVSVRYVEAGEELYREDTLVIECLSPLLAKESENDTSLVFLLQTPELVVWLMGDAGVSAEEELIERLGGYGGPAHELLTEKFCILKVGHHGSKTSTGEAFVSFSEPDICVISCGYKNSYGHPHSSVVNRLMHSGSEIYRTDLQGCVTVRMRKSGGVLVEVWRK